MTRELDENLTSSVRLLSHNLNGKKNCKSLEKHKTVVTFALYYTS